MTLVSKIAKARKKRGKCQTCRESPVRSRTATTSQAARKPRKEITKIQGMSRSKILNSGRFAIPKTLKSSATARKLAEFPFYDNDPPFSRENLSAERLQMQGGTLTSLLGPK